jgi:hypothetical protein
MKLGKLPATRDDRDLLFATYKAGGLKEAPVGFGHLKLVENPWGMLGNDTIGDCACAGPAHETMLLNAAAGKQVVFTDEDVIEAYSAISGYVPGDPDTDVGCDIRDVLRYRVSTGFTDSTGQAHKIGAYVALHPGNWIELLEALEVFECVGIGIQVPDYAEQQFSDRQPWSVEPGEPNIIGGHYIPVVSRPKESEVDVITWGAAQLMTKAFYKEFCDEAWAYVSTEDIGSSGKTLEGFDLAQLNADLQQV